MNIYKKKQRWKLFLLISAVLIGAGSLLYTNRLVRELAADERKKIELWAESTRLLVNSNIFSSNSSEFVTFTLKVLENNTQIPVILTNENGEIQTYRNLDSARVHNEDYLYNSLKKMKTENDSIVIQLNEDTRQYIYYRNSHLLRILATFPYVQLAVIILFLFVSYIAFSISRKAEQNQVWTGLSKETAHQLGTPISSLLGWIEMLKQAHSDETATTELEKDAVRLEKIANRFSKIGSKPNLTKQDIIPVIQNSLDYIKTRRGRSVEFETDFPEYPLEVPVNETLIDWVIENLCKNAMDAIEGFGKISVKCTQDEKHVIIDVADNGKGLPKSKYKTIFKPGYTTKQRGWGLGLSLSKRIVQMYHKGKIFVVSSDPSVRTVFRIILKK
ncbi:PAS domain-containing sensor histidine kinase [Bacteroidota bacterium]